MAIKSGCNVKKTTCVKFWVSTSTGNLSSKIQKEPDLGGKLNAVRSQNVKFLTCVFFAPKGRRLETGSKMFHLVHA